MLMSSRLSGRMVIRLMARDKSEGRVEYVAQAVTVHILLDRLGGFDMDLKSLETMF